MAVYSANPPVHQQRRQDYSANPANNKGHWGEGYLEHHQHNNNHCLGLLQQPRQVEVSLGLRAQLEEVSSGRPNPNSSKALLALLEEVFLGLPHHPQLLQDLGLRVLVEVCLEVRFSSSLFSLWDILKADYSILDFLQLQRLEQVKKERET